MRVYELILAVTLIAALLATLVAWHRLRPRCPKCGARRGQATASERALSTKDRMFEQKDRWAVGRSEPRLGVRRRTVVSAIVTCSRCGHQYEWTRLVERDVL